MHRYNDYFLAWDMREKGFLPHAGGWAEQPYYWIEALQIIDGQRAQRALELAAEQRQDTPE